MKDEDSFHPGMEGRLKREKNGQRTLDKREMGERVQFPI